MDFNVPNSCKRTVIAIKKLQEQSAILHNQSHDEALRQRADSLHFYGTYLAVPPPTQLSHVLIIYKYPEYGNTDSAIGRQVVKQFLTSPNNCSSKISNNSDCNFKNIEFWNHNFNYNYPIDLWFHFLIIVILKYKSAIFQLQH